MEILDSIAHERQFCVRLLRGRLARARRCHNHRLARLLLHVAWYVRGGDRENLDVEFQVIVIRAIVHFENTTRLTLRTSLFELLGQCTVNEDSERRELVVLRL